jgi:hypothetical protein
MVTPSFGPRNRRKRFAEGGFQIRPRQVLISENIIQEIGKTACGDGIPLYIFEALRTAALKIFLGGIVHQSNYVAINGDQPCAGRHHIADGTFIFSNLHVPGSTAKACHSSSVVIGRFAQTIQKSTFLANSQMP